MTFRYVAPDGRPAAEHVYDNLICTGMDSLLAAFLNGEGIGTGSVYCAVGTGVTAPNYNDTQLTAELGRAILATNQRTGNIVTFSFTFTPASVVASLTEAGVFVNATSATNNGTLVNHVLITEDKTAAMTLVVEAQFTIQ